jgi:hypothetical protein
MSNIYTAGLNNVGSYQVSGAPYLSGAIDATTGDLSVINFPFVTRWIQIANSGSSVLNYSFSANGPTTTPGNLGFLELITLLLPVLTGLVLSEWANG